MLLDCFPCSAVLRVFVAGVGGCMKYTIIVVPRTHLWASRCSMDHSSIMLAI